MAGNPYIKIISFFVAFVFGLDTILMPVRSYGQALQFLPEPATVLNKTAYTPVLLKGLRLSSNPLEFDFIIEPGDKDYTPENVQEEALRLIKYFLAALTVPEKDMWVNLSPYEGDRLIPEEFGMTEMGRDMLGQDYILKQFTASLLHPQNEKGKVFWEALYSRLYNEYGVTEVPVDSFNKVWIVPDSARLFQNDKGGFIINSRLKVMLDSDYLALEKNSEKAAAQTKSETQVPLDALREIIIPEIEREVNEGQNFTSLRQIYSSLILAVWYKNQLKNSILGQSYVNKKIVAGVDIEDKDEKHKIYERYLQAFKDGLVNMIQEEYDPAAQQIIPRKYFSGGMILDKVEDSINNSGMLNEVKLSDRAMVVTTNVEVKQDVQNSSRRHFFGTLTRLFAVTAITSVVPNTVLNAAKNLDFHPDPIDELLKNLIGDRSRGGIAKILGRTTRRTSSSAENINLGYDEARTFNISVPGIRRRAADAARAVKAVFQPFGQGRFRLVRTPAEHVTVVLDNSGSFLMKPGDRIDKVSIRNRALKKALSILKPNKYALISVAQDAEVQTDLDRDGLIAEIPTEAKLEATYLYNSILKAVEATPNNGVVYVFTDGKSDTAVDKFEGDPEPGQEELHRQILEGIGNKNLKLFFVGINDKRFKKGTPKEVMQPFFDKASQKFQGAERVKNVFIENWDETNLTAALEGFAQEINTINAYVEIDADPTKRLGYNVSLMDRNNRAVSESGRLMQNMWYGNTAVKPEALPVIAGSSSGLSVNTAAGQLEGSVTFEVDGQVQDLTDPRWTVENIITDLPDEEHPIPPVKNEEQIILGWDYSGSVDMREIGLLRDQMVEMEETYGVNFQGIVHFGALGVGAEYDRDRMVTNINELIAKEGRRRDRAREDRRRGRRSREDRVNTPGWQAMELLLKRAIEVKRADMSKPVRIILGTDLHFNVRPEDRETFFERIRPLIKEASELGINMSVFGFRLDDAAIRQSVVGVESFHAEKISDGTWVNYKPVNNFSRNTAWEMVLAMNADIVPLRIEGRDVPFATVLGNELLSYEGEQTIAAKAPERFDIIVKDNVTGERKQIRVVLTPEQQAALPVDKGELNKSREVFQVQDAGGTKDSVGGIDLDPSMLNMDVQGQRSELDIPANMGASIPILSVNPVILRIVPVSNISQYLEDEESVSLAPSPV